MPPVNEKDSSSRHDEENHSKESTNSPAATTYAYEASSLTENATKIQKGNAAASEAALREVLNMKNGGYLKDVAQDLKESGNTKFTYGANGDVEHIIFNSSDGKSSVDMDLQHEEINGKSSAQIREAEIKQAKEYLGAALSDPKMTDASNRPLSPEDQAAAKELMGALLDGDVAAMTKAGQQIMKNPESAKSTQAVLDRIEGSRVIEFQTDEKGQLYMKANTPDFDAVIVPASGAASAADFDFWGKRDNSQHPTLDTTLNSASAWSLTEASTQIDSSEGHLEMVDRLPADGYTNMKSLERTPTMEPGDGAKLDALIAKDLSDMTSEQRRNFDKIHNGDHLPDFEKRREEEEEEEEEQQEE
jgi:hypothetical protein